MMVDRKKLSIFAPVLQDICCLYLQQNNILEVTLYTASELEKEEQIQLSQIVEAINNRFGTEFTEADRLLFDQVGLDLINDEAIIKQAKTNSFESFLQGSLRDKSIEKFIDRMDINNSTTSNILNNEKLADAVIFKYLAKFIYDRINAA